MSTHQDQAHSIISTKIPDASISSLLSTRLGPHLPYSLPLYRRLQFHLAHPNPPHAHAFIAIDNGSPDCPETAPWLAAHIDLSNAGQTQIWVYASWERDSSPTSDSDSDEDLPLPSPAGTSPIPPLPTRRLLFLALFRHINTNLVPTLPLSPPPPWLALERSGKSLSKPYSRSKALFGTLNSCLWRCLPHRMPGFVSRVDRWYAKFLFEPPPSPGPGLGGDYSSEAHAPRAAPTVQVPNGATSSTRSERKRADLTFAPLPSAHLQTVLDRSHIPRTLDTLSQLQSIGLFPSPSSDSSPLAPVAWGFLGKDASLSSLHTEPEYRGLGLASRVSERLFEMQRAEGSIFADVDVSLDGSDEAETGAGPSVKQGWSHADVSESNGGSLRVMEKLGGRVGWRVCWVEVEVSVLFTGSQSVAVEDKCC